MEQVKCIHCGEICDNLNIRLGDNHFCCEGCKMVYEILNENKLCEYYNINETPGTKNNIPITKSKYDYLEDESIITKIIDYSDEKLTSVTFDIPKIHCSSCIWLLENLHKLDISIIKSTVNFISKKVTVTFNNNNISLRGVVELLAKIGYEPNLNLDSLEKRVSNDINRNLYYKVGIAGFCLGNIMLFSFPEYLSIDASSETLKKIFGTLNIIISLPLFFYSGSEYYISAFKGLRKKHLNIDVPITIGIVAIFLQSLFDIVFGIGSGYLDTLAGLIFFLLAGKLYQNKIYEKFNFERDYKAFFPLSITLLDKGFEKTIPITKVKIGDKILIRNGEMIPADGLLYNGNAEIDYSLITGESVPVHKEKGSFLYAGGRQVGSSVEIEVIKAVSQSYLTQIWNNQVFNKEEESDTVSLSKKISHYFTPAILMVSLFAFFLWFDQGLTKAISSFTSVLIIACPCGLALSSPFTLGNILRIFGRNGFYLKNINIIEKISHCNTLVFDKTGTITQKENSQIGTVNLKLNENELLSVKSVLRHSTHPLSVKLYTYLLNHNSPSDRGLNTDNGKSHLFINNIEQFSETSGVGIEGYIDGNKIRIGKLSFVGKADETNGESLQTKVHISINEEYKGFFTIFNSYRSGLERILDNLRKRYNMFLITGDNEGEKHNLLKFFKLEENILFNKSPFEKIEFIERLKKEGNKVIMIGDGLNDAGALKVSNVGIAVSDDKSLLTPSSDAILSGDSFSKFTDFLSLSNIGVKIIYVSFIISLLYNFLGIYFAVFGYVTPLLSAILMPASSITVVLFTISTSTLFARKLKL